MCVVCVESRLSLSVCYRVVAPAAQPAVGRPGQGPSRSWRPFTCRRSSSRHRLVSHMSAGRHDV